MPHDEILSHLVALFSPVRRRLQSMTARRFDRDRYDAERVVAAFSGGLQTEWTSGWSPMSYEAPSVPPSLPPQSPYGSPTP